MIFNKNDKVKSKVNAQGLNKGEIYTIIGGTTQTTAFGDFVTYTLQGNDGGEHQVGNGHLVLTLEKDN